jgi:hypothetical protein
MSEEQLPRGMSLYLQRRGDLRKLQMLGRQRAEVLMPRHILKCIVWLRAEPRQVQVQVQQELRERLCLKMQQAPVRLQDLAWA